MTTVKSHFVGNFKVGDNIVYNLQLLKILYRQFETLNENEKVLLCKPIIITLVSICEAVLFDLNYRINKFTSQGVQNISKQTLTAIRKLKLSKYEKHIDCVEKYLLFGPTKTKIYERLHELRKLRNRIHIQNKHGDFEPDEIKAFSLKRKMDAEKTTEFILKCASIKFGRPKHCYHVEDFVLPWKNHFSIDKVAVTVGVEQ